MEYKATAGYGSTLQSAVRLRIDTTLHFWTRRLSGLRPAEMTSSYLLLLLTLLLLAFTPISEAFTLAWAPKSPSGVAAVYYARTPHYGQTETRRKSYGKSYVHSKASIIPQESKSACTRYRCEDKPCCQGQCLRLQKDISLCLIMPNYFGR